MQMHITGDFFSMSAFIGRQEELQLLKKLIVKDSASLIVLKGRRRIGKSRLLEEFGKAFSKAYVFSGLPPSEELCAASQRKEFQRQLNQQTGEELKESLSDWGDLFWHLSEIAKTGSVLIVLDEISWMGSQDPEFLGKLKTAWDLYFKKNDRLILALCGSVSSWIEKNILSSTGFLGRESLALTVEELPIQDCYKFWGKPYASNYEKMKVIAITGGIPRYLESIEINETAEAIVQSLCFSKTGILFNEFEKIFSDLFTKNNAQYKRIVTLLADGVKDRHAISDSLNLKCGGDISDYLDNLVKSGFLSRDYTWDINRGSVSKLSNYRLKDNYSRFYLKYILPNKHKIEAGGISGIALDSLKAWSTIMGLQFENIVLANRGVIKRNLKIRQEDIVSDNPFFQRKTTRQKGCQIDYMIQTKYNTIYLCEIKFSSREVGCKVISEVKEKVERLKLPKGFSIRTVLIYFNGITEALEDEKYFNHLINFNEVTS